MPGDAAELHAENARLRESAGRLRMLPEDKAAKIAELEERWPRRGSCGTPPLPLGRPGRWHAPSPTRSGRRALAELVWALAKAGQLEQAA